MTDTTIVIDNLQKNQQFTVGDRENKTFIIFLADKKDQIGKVKIVIRGKQSHVQILGIIIGSAEQKIELFTLQDHQDEESISDLLIKSVLFDRARFNYQGLIQIEKGAQKSNAYQKNQNLLLSPYAWADSRPYLEILANDVRCTHGATIGKIDEEQLYYLKTRGLDESCATKLIINGFLREVIERIPDQKIQNMLEDKIEEQINRLVNLPRSSYS
ncbi:SufD family Fe-S cluster assembly protein [Candidatus Gottesmanbacteria bacterium]|nr:SufD family Fe-S cluster assembly protein [Candidatus Gottesmanbacteria bacterium]